MVTLKLETPAGTVTITSEPEDVTVNLHRKLTESKVQPAAHSPEAFTVGVPSVTTLLAMTDAAKARADFERPLMDTQFLNGGHFFMEESLFRLGIHSHTVHY
jgi:formamidopyrimidine-DNA glycosylase